MELFFWVHTNDWLYSDFQMPSEISLLDFGSVFYLDFFHRFYINIAKLVRLVVRLTLTDFRTELNWTKLKSLTYIGYGRVYADCWE